MKWDNLIAIATVGFLGAFVGMRLDDYLNPRHQAVASLVITGIPPSVLATCVWALVSHPGSTVVILLGLLTAAASFMVLLLAGRLPIALAPFAVLATGWAIGSTLKQWILIDSLPVLGIVLAGIVLSALWFGERRGYWQWDNLLVFGFLSCAWLQALALDGLSRIGRR